MRTEREDLKESKPLIRLPEVHQSGGSPEDRLLMSDDVSKAASAEPRLPWGGVARVEDVPFARLVRIDGRPEPQFDVRQPP